MLMAVTMFLACSTDNEPIKPTADKLRLESFQKYGEYHNLFLTNFNNNFEANAKVKYLDEGIEYISSFNKDFVEELNLPPSEKEVFIKSLDKAKRFVNPTELYEACYSESAKSSKGNLDGDLFRNIESSLENDYIDQFEYQKLLLIGEKVNENYYGTLSDVELEVILLQVRNDWIKQGYYENSKYGRTLAMAISISLSSINWWKDNQDALFDTGSDAKIAAWVAADIIGACYGAVVSGIGSYATQGEVNWGAVGISAVGGAVAGSTGGIGKAASFIRSLF